MKSSALALIIVVSAVVSASAASTRALERAIPMVRLAASPEAYFGKTVRTTGFLAIEQGHLRIYLTKDAFVFEDNASSVLVEVPNRQAATLAKNANRNYVEFTAKFDVAAETGDLRPPLGVFTSFALIRYGEFKERLNSPSTNELLIDISEAEPSAK